MMIPPFTLPSRPATSITLKEATVSDCLDFADIDPDHEEEVTTLFLNRLQDKGTFVDCKTWTGEDRRFGLFWYWLHTVDDVEMPITYTCGHCGKSHTYLQDYRKLADRFASINGLPERDIEFKGRTITVKPIDGAGQEALEALRLSLTGKRTFRERIDLERVSLATGIPRIEIANLKLQDYAELQDQTELALIDMYHGLESEQVEGQIIMLLPPHQCPNTSDKEATTQVRVLFRADEWIPAL